MELFKFGSEVLQRLDVIVERLDVIVERLDVLLQRPSGESDSQTANSGQDTKGGQTPPVVAKSQKSRKNQVSDRMYQEKSPAMIRLLLREGCRTTGLRVPSLASELGISGDTVTRLARRIAENEGLLYLVPNSGGGGKGTLIKITNRRYDEAEQWAKDFAAP